MDIHAYPLSMDVHEYHWMFMNIHGCPLIYMPGYPWISIDHPWISMDSQWLSTDIYVYPWISMDIHRYPWISVDIIDIYGDP